MNAPYAGDRKWDEAFAAGSEHGQRIARQHAIEELDAILKQHHVYVKIQELEALRARLIAQGT